MTDIDIYTYAPNVLMNGIEMLSKCVLCKQTTPEDVVYFDIVDFQGTWSYSKRVPVHVSCLWELVEEQIKNISDEQRRK